MSYSYLEEWIGKKLFESKLLHKENEFEGYHLKYVHPEPIKIQTEKFGMQLTYDFGVSDSSYRMPEIKSKALVRVESKIELPFEEWSSIIYHIRNFLSLAMISTGALVYPLSIIGETEKNKLVNTKDVLVYSPIEIILGFGELVVPSKEEKIPYWDILFRFDDISHQPESYFQNWFDKSELLKPIYDLFFGTLYNPRMYITNQFSDLVQAIEAYHRRTTRNCDLLPEEYDKIVSEILNGTPEQHKVWLKEKLEYGNEPNLRKRLKEIINVLGIKEFIENNGRGIDSFIHRVVITRNYLTHYDKKLEDKALRPEQFYPYVQMLRTVLLTCLLKEMGFESGTMKKMIRKYFEKYVHHLALVM